MKVIIAGSREGVDEGLVWEMLSHISWTEYPFPISEVVCGEAKGVDTYGKSWGRGNNIPVTSFPADWKMHGVVAGHLRNAQMAEYADALIAFSHDESKGTEGMIAKAQRKRMPCVIIKTYSELQTQKSPREEAE